MKQIEFDKVGGWGGKRLAGRKNRSGLVSHGRRERVDIRRPLHITLKLKPQLAHLRNRKLLKDFRRAVGRVREFGLFGLHFSLQGDHLHFVAEARSSEALESGMKSLGSSFGKAIRAVIGGRGRVFAGSFHLHVLKTPTEMKRALKYVLLNFSKHAKLVEYIDEFSSGSAFNEWRALLGCHGSPKRAGNALARSFTHR